MIGSTIGHYKIIDKLGEGGMGIVYKAEDLKLKRVVALKFLPRQIRSNPVDRQRFETEAQAAAALNHPNIAQVYSIEEADDEFFITMEFLDGKTLNQPEIRSFVPSAILTLVGEIASGLKAAHARGIVHRDIKSSNIMVTVDGKAKIMDFGLAKLTAGPDITRTGTTVGTAAYMSPEQIQGKEADERSDIWSFGAVVYELLSGTLPFGGTYEQAVFYSILNQDPKPLTDLPEPLQPLTDVVAKCLAKDPADRYQSFSELIDDLEEGTATPRSRFFRRPKRPVRTNPFLATTAVVVLTLLLFTLVIGPHRVQRWLGFSDVPDEQHLAVLPFTSIGADSSKQPLCDGLVETITSKLTQLEQFHGSLWVVPSSEVRQNRTRSPGEAYQLFGANLVVTGNLQVLANVFRLTLNLVDARNLRQLSSSVFDIKEANLSGLQDQSVTRVLDMLNLELNSQSKKIIAAGQTSVSGANKEYLVGLGYLQRYDIVANLDAAVDHFEASVGLDSTYALAFAGLGEAYWRKYEAEREISLAEMAESRCEKAFLLDSTLPRINIALGLVHAGRGKNEKAIEDFQRALALDPGNDAAYRGLAKVYEKDGNTEEAEATFKRAIKLKPNFWAGHYDLAVFYFQRSKYEEAAGEFQEVVRLTPDNFRAYSSLGGTYYMLNRLPEAQKMLERSLEIRKTYFAASNLATLYYVQGLYEESARTYEEALKLNDQDYQVWGNLGGAYYWAPGEREKATAAFRRAADGAEQSLKINPKDAETMATLAGYRAVLGENAKAEALVDKSLKVDPDNSRIMYLAATTYEWLGKREKALYWIGRALEHGYSLSEIEQQPELKQLLADKRFADLKSKYQKQ